MLQIAIAIDLSDLNFPNMTKKVVIFLLSYTGHQVDYQMFSYMNYKIMNIYSNKKMRKATVQKGKHRV